MDFIINWFKKYQDGRHRDAMMAIEQESAIKALTAGQLHPRARERIERQQASGKNFFSSDLTVREYLLCREAGFQTLGQVMGSCFYNVSLVGSAGRTLGLTQSEYNHDKFYSNAGSLQKESGELKHITEAQLKARKLAVKRMLQEAEMMGAHGVIGVRVKSSNFNWSTRMTEFTAFGTAIRLPAMSQGKGVFSSDLNGQEFWQLYCAGYTPRDLAFGVCSYYVKCDPETRQMIDPTVFDWMAGRTQANQEVMPFTQGFYTARSLAMARLSEDAMGAQADGMVSMEVDYTVQTIEYQQINKTFHDMVLHFIATGTSIARDHESIPRDHKPILAMDMRRGGRGGFVSDFGVGAGGFSAAEFDSDDIDDDDE